MSFTQAVQSVFQNYANFSGRAMRSEYWWWFLFNILAGVALGFIELAIGLASVLTGLWTLGTILPNWSVAARRLHDRGQSAWVLLALPAMTVPALLFPPLIFVLLLIAISILVVLALPGDKLPNDFGPPPTVP